jgi:hypothetical protein
MSRANVEGTDAEDSWVGADDWDAWRGELRLDEAPELWLGIDIGIKRDSSAIVEVGWVEERLHVRATVLTPAPSRPVALADVREKVAGMGGEPLQGVVFDPNAFRESAQELEERGLPMTEFAPNNARMVPASEKLYELIRERRLARRGRRVGQHHQGVDVGTALALRDPQVALGELRLGGEHVRAQHRSPSWKSRRCDAGDQWALARRLAGRERVVQLGVGVRPELIDHHHARVQAMLQRPELSTR